MSFPNFSRWNPFEPENNAENPSSTRRVAIGVLTAPDCDFNRLCKTSIAEEQTEAQTNIPFALIDHGVGSEFGLVLQSISSPDEACSGGSAPCSQAAQWRLGQTLAPAPDGLMIINVTEPDYAGTNLLRLGPVDRASEFLSTMTTVLYSRAP